MAPDMNTPTRFDCGAVSLLKNERARIRGVLIGLVLASTSAAPFPAQAHEAMVVSATVIPVARIYMPSEPPPLQVSAADVARGYIDAPRALLLRVDSNSRAGFALEVYPLSPWCTAVALQGLDTEVDLDRSGGSVVQRWQSGKSRALALRARFSLAPAVQPGLYAWPLRLFARPL